MAYDPNFVQRLRKLSKERLANGRTLTAREVRAFVAGDPRMLSADELRSVAADTTADERLRAQARAQLAMLEQ